jgi:hypothetical protein
MRRISSQSVQSFLIEDKLERETRQDPDIRELQCKQILEKEVKRNVLSNPVKPLYIER